MPVCRGGRIVRAVVARGHRPAVDRGGVIVHELQGVTRRRKGEPTRPEALTGRLAPHLHEPALQVVVAGDRARSSQRDERARGGVDGQQPPSGIGAELDGAMCREPWDRSPTGDPAAHDAPGIVRGGVVGIRRIRPSGRGGSSDRAHPRPPPLPPARALGAQFRSLELHARVARERAQADGRATARGRHRPAELLVSG